ncbi:MAG: PepSY-associated TM helix domain-containing protein [Pseudomonadota bacterium]
MDRDRRVRIYDAHSWTGISLGLVLFVVCFTGSLAMFARDLQTWEDPARRLPLVADPIAIDPLFQQWVESEATEHEAEVTFMGMNYPTAEAPFFRGNVNLRDPDGVVHFHQQRWDPATGAVIPDRQDGLATWVLDFHRDLMWPEFLGGRQIGRGLVGIFGIVMMLSILTGIITHRKILREMFTLRLRRSVRVKWKDGHNALGVWTLPFSIMIAFTGAWLGIIVLLLPVTGMLVVKGDSEKLIALLSGPQIEATGEAAPMISLDEIARRSHSSGDGRLPTAVFIQHYGDTSAVYDIQYKPDTELMYSESERINGVTGAALPLTGLQERTAATRTLGAITPLHYGLFGGVALKCLYLALGLALSVVVVLGNMVWIERRWHSAEGSRSPNFYHRLSQLTVGVSMGVVLASVAIFYADRLYTGAEESRIVFIGQMYFLAWFATIVFSFLRSNNYQTVRFLMRACGAGLMALPVFDALTAGATPWAEFATGHVAAPAINATLFVLGLGCVMVAQRMPRERREYLGKRKRDAAPDTGAAEAEQSAGATTQTA